MDDIGHNSLDAKALSAFVDRIERLSEEKKALADDIKDVYAEAKLKAYDVKALRRIVAARQRDRDKRSEEEAAFDRYAAALNLFD